MIRQRLGNTKAYERPGWLSKKATPSSPLTSQYNVRPKTKVGEEQRRMLGLAMTRILFREGILLKVNKAPCGKCVLLFSLLDRYEYVESLYNIPINFNGRGPGISAAEESALEDDNDKLVDMAKPPKVRKLDIGVSPSTRGRSSATLPSQLSYSDDSFLYRDPSPVTASLDRKRLLKASPLAAS